MKWWLGMLYTLGYAEVSHKERWKSTECSRTTNQTLRLVVRVSHGLPYSTQDQYVARFRRHPIFPSRSCLISPPSNLHTKFQLPRQSHSVIRCTSSLELRIIVAGISDGTFITDGCPLASRQVHCRGWYHYHVCFGTTQHVSGLPPVFEHQA